MKIAIFVLIACTVMSSYAQKREESEMRNIAKQYFFKEKKESSCEEELSEKVLNFGRLYRYTDKKQPFSNGFVLISENKKSPRILAFGNQVDFPMDSLPKHISHWLSGYANLKETEDSAETVDEWLDASHLYVNPVTPLLDSINWGQDNPYNLDCPQIGEEYAPTGCVATAVAQIMKYFQWPKRGYGQVDYITSTNKIPVSCSLETFIDWEHVYDVYAPVEVLTDIRENTTNNVISSLKDMYISPLYSGARACVMMENMVAVGTSSFKGEYALLLFDEDNNFIQRISEIKSVEKTSSAQIAQYGRIYPAIPSSLPDNDYVIKCGVRNGSSGSWSVAKRSAITSIYKDSIHIRKVGSHIYTNGNIYPCSLTREEVSPISILLRNVGASLNMDYDLTGSGTSTAKIPIALTQYYNYDTDMFVANPGDFTDEQWHRLLQQELASGRPVYYSGLGSLNEGHAFVIDGVMEKDGYAYYHVNWGWDGLCNGYFLLNMLQPGTVGTGGVQGANYSNQAQMVVGIQPENGMENTRLSCKEYKICEHELFPGEVTSTVFTRLMAYPSQELSGKLSVRLRNQQTNDTIVVYEEQRTVKTIGSSSPQYCRIRIPQEILPGEYDVFLGFETQEGRTVDFINPNWPSVKIRSLSEWSGGSLSSAKQCVAVSSVEYDWTTSEVGRITVVCDSLLNILPKANSGYLSLLVCNMDGKLLSNLSESTALLMAADAVTRNTRINGTVSQNIPNGEYILKIGFRETGTDVWTYVRKLEYSENIGWASFRDFSIPFTMYDGVFVLEGIRMTGADIPWKETGIVSIEAESNKSISVYNIDGTLLLKNSGKEDLKSLPKGNYIIGKNKIHILKK